jgi:hypothetical protein
MGSDNSVSRTLRAVIADARSAEAVSADAEAVRWAEMDRQAAALRDVTASGPCAWTLLATRPEDRPAVVFAFERHRGAVERAELVLRDGLRAA